MKPNMINVVFVFLFFQLLSFATINISFCSGSTYGGCIQSEREALLRFKQDLIDPSNRLASWFGDGDCCKWAGVVCDNFTGHVLQLNLRNPHLEFFASEYDYPFSDAEYEAYNRSKLGGKINPSLLDLACLIHLDLSFNDFEGIQIPRFLGSMKNLRYLNLSKAGFGGIVPQQLGNLSNLQHLDLHHLYPYELYVENLMWISSLSLLKHLDLNGVNLSKTSDQWLLKISSLPYLEILGLSSCQLQHSPQISIANFSSLTTLDLSGNEFDNSIPSWVFDLNHLVFLDMCGNNFQGLIPNGLENLTSLRHLDLTNNNFNSLIPCWLSRISHLEYLSLSRNDLQGSISNSLRNLTSIRTLDLSFNNFNSSIPCWLSRISHLEYLSLSRNDLQGSISSSFGNLTSIKTLDLSLNKLEGRIPTSFGRLCNLRSISMSFLNLNSSISEVLDIFSGCISARLESLDLSNCQLFGQLTDQIGKFKNIKILDLHSNSIYGPIPSSLWKLSSLQSLDLSYNKLNATLSQIHFSNLTRLVVLSLAKNSQIVVNVNSDWVPPFQLQSLNLRSCHIGPHFPSWLHSQKSLDELDISNNGISDVIPDWFWKSLSQFSSLNISHNQIHQKIPNLTNSGEIGMFDLSSNKFFGPLPQIPFDVIDILDLSSNAFSGSILQFLCYGVNKSRATGILNLENNSLSGELPDCGWKNWQNLWVLNLGNNKFTGTLPTSIGKTNLLSLILRKNNFSGVIPVEALENCTSLEVLDASENRFVGNVLKEIGERFSNMMILKFRSNNLHGFLPAELCCLSSLHILDLANNHLSGNIPSCINNLSAMVTVDHSDSNDLVYIEGAGIYFGEHALLVRQGMAYEYSTILKLVRAIDLSNNNFSGDIPKEITSLGALWWLNLSHNSFIGRIPKTIGVMREIQYIDFSANQLCGEIPPSISNLTFLSYLNLSNNNLTGRIPSGTQLQGFDPSCFTGNDLHGCPLPKDCNVSVQTPSHQSGRGKDGNKHEVDWFYISLVLGFVLGFWGFIGPLLIHRKWRCIYYGFLDSFGHKIYFIVNKCW